MMWFLRSLGLQKFDMAVAQKTVMYIAQRNMVSLEQCPREEANRNQLLKGWYIVLRGVQRWREIQEPLMVGFPESYIQQSALQRRLCSQGCSYEMMYNSMKQILHNPVWKLPIKNVHPEDVERSAGWSFLDSHIIGDLNIGVNHHCCESPSVIRSEVHLVN